MGKEENDILVMFALLFVLGVSSFFLKTPGTTYKHQSLRQRLELTLPSHPESDKVQARADNAQ